MLHQHKKILWASRRQCSGAASAGVPHLPRQSPNPQSLPITDQPAATDVDQLDRLLRDSGKYVVIKGREIIGIYGEFETAVDAAFRFAPEPVLVKRIVEKEPIRQVGHVVS